MNDKDKEFSELVGEALGRASMAWSETPTGIFDGDTCCVLHIDIINAHYEDIKKLQAENLRLSTIVNNQKTVIEINQAENAKLRECVESFVDKYFDLPVELRLKKGIKEGEESLRARQVLKKLLEE